MVMGASVEFTMQNRQVCVLLASYGLERFKKEMSISIDRQECNFTYQLYAEMDTNVSAE